jgi:uncharacterized protein (DUF885 family)
MPSMTQPPPASRPVRNLADAYVLEYAELDPLVATMLGLPEGQDDLPDLSPAGYQARDELRRATQAQLMDAELAAEASGGFRDADERRCARLLTERLETELAVSRSREQLRAVSNIFGPPQAVRGVFMLMPTATADDWLVISRRIGRVPQAFAQYRQSLAEGASLGLHAAPRQVQTVTEQLDDWLATADGAGWFTGFAAPAPVTDSLRADLDRVCAAADAAVAELRDWLLSDYLPGASGTPDGMGQERYHLGARRWNGADLDLTEVYEWGWSQYRQILAEMSGEAEQILPGSTPVAAMRHLDEHSEAVEGVEQIRERLQQMMDSAMSSLAGTHFDLADPIRVVEARIAPPGSAAAPYYTGPSRDFSRPGRTWLPTLGRTRFPLWNLISTWYHEGVPGHHLQIAQWRYLSSQLSLYQTSVGGVSACSEGWALYAERLMDELGYFENPDYRLGFLRAQVMRAVRVVVDIGMHLELNIAADDKFHPGERWTPDLGQEFLYERSCFPRDFMASELDRYLGWPSQATCYKLGERVWLSARDDVKHRLGAAFDQKAFHAYALGLGPIGLDQLDSEVGAFGERGQASTSAKAQA